MESDREKEIEAVVRELAEEGRQRLGGPPDTELLRAYSRDELTPEERDRVEELLAHYPEAVRELLALSAFHYEGKPGDPDYLTDEEVEEDWRTLQEQLRIKARPATFRQKSRRHWMGIAAMVLLGLSVIVNFTQWHSARSPRSDLYPYELSPDDVTKGDPAGGSTALAPEFSQYFLRLNLPPTESYSDYRVEIVRAGEDESGPAWSRTGLRRSGDDSFFLLLPRRFFQRPGIYQIRLFGLNGEQSTLLATYTVES